ncbi:MAG: molybdenum cofactor biosynthesis protein MoaE [Saprospiraceae bacterium]|nr:molybdenum cofactor biosynthesis protein MoaE [Saprospiraceae bacterium]
METTNIFISKDPLSIDTAYQSVLDVSCGGNCLFIGTVRNKNKGKTVTHLDFETYEEMAVKEMAKIAARCKEKFDVKKIAIHHRSGYVGLTDIAVIIAVASPHRTDAFEACKFAIDTLKETVPIWKKEHLEDGSYWVGARP